MIVGATRRERPADFGPHPGALPHLPPQAGLLLRLYARIQQPPAPRPSGVPTPLLRGKHRLYQADWLLRFYHFQAEEILDENQPYLDPPTGSQMRLGTAPPGALSGGGEPGGLRDPAAGTGHWSQKVPGDFGRPALRPFELPRSQTAGVVLKRAQYFITCSGRMEQGLRVSQDGLLRHLVALEAPNLAQPEWEQLSLFSMGGAS